MKRFLAAAMGFVALAFAAPAFAANIAYCNTPLDTIQAAINTCVIGPVNSQLVVTGGGNLSTAITVPIVASPVNLIQITPGATGTAPIINVGGASVDTNVGLTLAGNGTGAVLVGGTTTTLAGLQVAQTASRVNDFVLTPTATGNTPGFEAGGAGSDAAVGVAFGTQGTGTIAFDTAITAQQFGVTHTASAVNALSVTGSTGSNAPVMSVVGTGTNVNASITGKGTGIATLGTQTTCTGTTTATCNAQRAVISITGLATAASTLSATMTVTDTSVAAATSMVLCQVNGYAGTGIPVAVNVIPGTGSFTMAVQNVSTGAALNATVPISCFAIN